VWSRKVLEIKGQGPGIYLWLKLTDSTCIVPSLGSCLVSMNFEIFGDDRSVVDCTIALYDSICTVSNGCLSLYLNIAGLRQNPGKTFSGVAESGKSRKILDFL